MMTPRDDPRTALAESADAAHDSLNAAGHRTRRALDRVVEGVESIGHRARTSDFGRRAGDAVQQGAQWMRDSGQRVKGGVMRASDRTVGYVRDEPVRSALMVLAAGALIYALVRLASSRRGDSTSWR